MSPTVARRLVYGMLVGALVTFPLAAWGPQRLYPFAMVGLYVCCFGPAIMIKVYERWGSK